MRFIKRILIAIIIIAVIAGGLFGYWKYKELTSLNSATLETILEDCSELTTQTLVITSWFEDTSGKIPFLTKNKYLVKYKATVEAGFDIQKVDFAVTDKKLVIMIPHCAVKKNGVNIQGKDLEFIDTNFSVVRAGKNAAAQSEVKAEEMALEYANSDESGLLKAADDNAVKLLKGIYQEVAGNREVEVTFK